MILQTANGPKEIKVADLDFTNLMCDLEDHDVDVMGLLDDDTRENMKILRLSERSSQFLPEQRILQKPERH